MLLTPDEFPGQELRERDRFVSVHELERTAVVARARMAVDMPKVPVRSWISDREWAHCGESWSIAFDAPGGREPYVMHVSVPAGASHGTFRVLIEGLFCRERAGLLGTLAAHGYAHGDYESSAPSSG